MSDEMKTITIRIPRPMYEALERAIEAGGYVGPSELIRGLLRKYLTENGFMRSGEEVSI